MKKPFGIYIHIPFCHKRCNYCDFLTAVMSQEIKEQYILALIKTIDEHETVLGNCPVSVYIGGGTPTAIKPEYISDIIFALKKKYDLSNAEISMECNPGSVDMASLKIYKNAGINRLSIGLQSVNDDELKALGRIHDYKKFQETFMAARECGFNNINVDLMSGLLNQTREKFSNSLNTVAKLNPEHISAYSLIIEENTPLWRYLDALEDKGEILFPNEDLERQMYYDTKDILSKYGYERYEISNYAKEGFTCKHNMLYWNRNEYIAFGLGAASFVKDKRYNNVSDIKAFIDLANANKSVCDSATVEKLEMKDAYAEFMFLGLRKMEGVSIEAFKKEFNTNIMEVYGSIINRHIANGLLINSDGYLKLTNYGIDISNSVMSDYMPD